jgi:hypothetical protein
MPNYKPGDRVEIDFTQPGLDDESEPLGWFPGTVKTEYSGIPGFHHVVEMDNGLSVDVDVKFMRPGN